MPLLILASESPRRSLLLSAAGFTHEVRIGTVDEALLEDESAQDAVLRLSSLKVDAVSRQPGEVVLGADTMVVLDGVPLGKPRDADHATEMLLTLSGRTHSVLTGWTAIGDAGERFGVAESRVTFRTLSRACVTEYVKDVQPFDKAGSYDLHGDDGRLVSAVHGSRANVMGLPLRDIVNALADLGIERSTPNL